MVEFEVAKKVAEYDSLSLEEISRKMCDLKKSSPLLRIEENNGGYIELFGNNVVPIGLDTLPEFYFIGRTGDYHYMSFEEAQDVLRREKELRVDKSLEARGISRQDVRNFMDYLCMSVSLEKKVHPEMYESQ
jgi:hypothetical protein